ncbi:unnamed protein product, partial [Allacma fusca]
MNFQLGLQIFFFLFLETICVPCNQPELPEVIQANAKCKTELGRSPSWE